MDGPGRQRRRGLREALSVRRNTRREEHGAWSEKPSASIRDNARESGPLRTPFQQDSRRVIRGNGQLPLSLSELRRSFDGESTGSVDAFGFGQPCPIYVRQVAAPAGFCPVTLRPAKKNESYVHHERPPPRIPVVQSSGISSVSARPTSRPRSDDGSLGLAVGAVPSRRSRHGSSRLVTRPEGIRGTASSSRSSRCSRHGSSRLVTRPEGIRGTASSSRSSRCSRHGSSRLVTRPEGIRGTASSSRASLDLGVCDKAGRCRSGRGLSSARRIPCGAASMPAARLRRPTCPWR